VFSEAAAAGAWPFAPSLVADVVLAPSAAVEAGSLVPEELMVSAAMDAGAWLSDKGTPPILCSVDVV
jgi:hypothetical protein